jgi:hypothetical protein
MNADEIAWQAYVERLRGKSGRSRQDSAPLTETAARERYIERLQGVPQSDSVPGEGGRTDAVFDAEVCRERILPATFLTSYRFHTDDKTPQEQAFEAYLNKEKERRKMRDKIIEDRSIFIPL